jgi:hypothetical protein
MIRQDRQFGILNWGEGTLEVNFRGLCLWVD